MDKIAKDLEDPERLHNTNLLYCHVENLRRSSQYGPIPGKDRKGTTCSDSESVKVIYSRENVDIQNTLKHELKRTEIEVMDKIAEDLEDAALQNNTIVL